MRHARFVGLLAAVALGCDAEPLVRHHTLFIGDSIMKGLAGDLQIIAASKKGILPSFTALPGYSISRGENFFAFRIRAFFADMIAPTEDAVIVSLGTADAFNLDFDLSYLDYQISAIVDAVPQGTRIYWLTLSELQHAVPAMRIREVNAALARNSRISLVDIGTAMDCLWYLFPQAAATPYPDGIHPRAELSACMSSVLIQQVESDFGE